MVATSSTLSGCTFFDPPKPYVGKNPAMHVAVNDLHRPYHDKLAVRAFMEFVQEHRPRMIHLLGDIIDGYSLSRFTQDPDRPTLQQELDDAREWLVELRDTCPGAAMVYSEGNHEERLRRYILTHAQALRDMREVTIAGQLGLADLHIGWCPAARPYRIGPLTYLHGNIIRKHSAFTAKATFEQVGGCAMAGHTHRFGTYYKTTLYDYYGSWECGCLADPLQQDYCPIPDWQQGWSVVWHYGDRFQVEPVVLTRGVYVFHGQMCGKPAPRQGFRYVPNLKNQAN